IHQVGHLDFDKAENIYKNLDSQKQKKYKVFSIAEPNDIKEYFQEADIIISRAGANTVSEIIYTKRTAVLIPIPWSYLDEQTKNAIYAKDYGIASILPQKDLNGERLLDEIIKVDNNWQNIINK